jgi:hypothetical protein
VGTGALPAIPADFFGPGSDPFVGQIALQGATGFVDTVMTRIETPVFPSDPVFTVGFVDIQLEQLDLVSTEPIIVTFNGGQNPELWNVRLGLAPDHSLSPVGSLTATKTHNNGGTFDVEFFVRPVFVLTKPPHTFELSLPELHFQAFGTPWVHNADSSLNLNAPNNGNFVPGVEELAPSVQQLVPMSAQEDTGAVLHTVIPSSGTPVPSSSEWIGALLAATFMVSALAFMRTQRRTA